MKLNLLAALVVAAAGAVPCGAASNIRTDAKFAYGANVGWLNWRASDADGVAIGQHFLSGWIWSANLGWISVGDGSPVNGFRYGNSTAADCGVNVNADGSLSGMAYGANIGWIRFADNTTQGSLPAAQVPRIDLKTGKFSGYAYSANCGWMDLGNAVSTLATTSIDPGPDSDGDGIPDQWELEHVGSLDKLSQSGDLDGDGVSDLDEYLADTDPTNAADVLRITGITAANGGAQVGLTWTSRPSRCYVIQARPEAISGIWEDAANPGIVSPDPGTTTTRVINGAAAPMQFYRVRSVVPGGAFIP